MKKLLISAAAASLIGLAATPANADIRVGVLRCTVSPGVGFVIGSSKGLQCGFWSSGGGRHEVYAGYINRLGVDVGWTSGGVLAWYVFAPSRPGPGALQGAYLGASAEATVVGGVSANALVGGLNNSITLQPVSVGAQAGLDAALTASGMRLDWAQTAVRKKKKRVRR
jgi:hypothetical protein